MKKHFISAMLSALLFLTGCSAESSPEPVQGTFFAMDTVMDFTIYGESGLIDQSESLIASLESLVSVTDANSELYAINQTGSGTLTGKASSLMEQALEICRRTDGALDLSIYPIVRAWGFTTGSYQVPDEAEIQALLPLVDYRKIQYDAATGTVTLPEGMEIDLGSVAKGYAGQLAAQMLREHGVQSALLNLGGNVQTVGAKPDGSPWQIGIKDPQGEDAMMVLSVEDQAVVTSGGYERYFEQDGVTYHHIIDPKTGYPAENGLVSVTIVSSDGTLADGLSTSLFIMGEEKAAEFWKAHSNEFEAIFATDDGTIYVTEGLKDSFTTDLDMKVITK